MKPLAEMSSEERLEWFSSSMADVARDFLVKEKGWTREDVNKLSDGVAKFIHFNIWMEVREGLK